MANAGGPEPVGSVGDTDPREHGPGWRYVMVPVSPLGTGVRQVASPGSRLVDATPEDPFILEPDQVSEKRGWEAGRDSQLSHKPVLIDALHPPTHAGLLISLPESNVYYTKVTRLNADGSSGPATPITADDLLAEDRRMGAPVYLNSTFGPGARIWGVVDPQVTGADGSVGPLSTWGSEWARDFATDRSLQLVTVSGIATSRVQVAHTPTGWQATIAPNQFDEGGVYPLTGDDAFRSRETEYATGLLMHPSELAMTLESLKTAGVADGELRDITAHYEQVVADNEKIQIETRPNAVDPQRVDVVRVSVRDENWNGSSYGRYEQQNDITPDYARTSRVQNDRWNVNAEAMWPERTFEVIQQAKAEHPHLAGQLDALYEAVRYPNAVEWAHERRTLGQINEATRQYADRWAGRPIDWAAEQQRATANWTNDLVESVIRPIVEAGVQVTVLGSEPLRAAAAALRRPAGPTTGAEGRQAGETSTDQGRVVRPTRDAQGNTPRQGL